MATANKPIVLYGPNGDVLRRSGGSNRLIRSATQSFDRERLYLLDEDYERLVSSLGRRVLQTLGKHLYWNIPALRGAVEDAAENSTSSYGYESLSKDRAWRDDVEARLAEHDKICDFAGQPNNMRTYRRALVRSQFVEGDMGTVFVTGDDGQPYLQTIPSHRIQSCGDEIVETGPMRGNRLSDGVIVDGFLRPIGYRVSLGCGYGDLEHVDIPAASMILSFDPRVSGQLRGPSWIGVGAWDWQDREEAKRWEMLAQKAGAGRVFVEENETGEAPIGSDFVFGPGAGQTGPQTASGLWREVIDGGINTYFKANSGSSLKAVPFDRPSSDQQAFSSQCLREALAGSSLSIDFNLDLTKIGGAPLRLLIDKINRMMAPLQDIIVEPALAWFNFKRVGSWITDGSMKNPPADWYKIRVQKPALLSADRKYESDVTLNEIRMGITTRRKAASQRGDELDAIRQANYEATRDLFTNAKALADEFGLEIDGVLERLESQGTPVYTPVDPEVPAAAKPGGPTDE